MGRWVNLGEYLRCGGQKTAELHNSPVVLTQYKMRPMTAPCQSVGDWGDGSSFLAVIVRCCRKVPPIAASWSTSYGVHDFTVR